MTVPQIKNTLIPLPTFAEQNRIAEVLSDIDELISSLEKLIAKKKAIKQGAMEQLLTGKNRLPGYKNGWEEKSIEDIAELSTATTSTDLIDTRHYVGTENMIKDKGGVRDNDIAVGYRMVREYRPNDILLSNIRPYLKKIWLSDRYGGCSNDVIVIRVKNPEELFPVFLYYLLSQDAFFEEIMANAVGTKMPRGDKITIKDYRIKYPCDITEQKNIAYIFESMDCEIEALEKKLNKAQQIKQGVMKKLLTGKTRLV